MQIVIDLSIEVKRRVEFTFAQAVPSRLFAISKRIPLCLEYFDYSTFIQKWLSKFGLQKAQNLILCYTAIFQLRFSVSFKEHIEKKHIEKKYIENIVHLGKKIAEQ